MGVPSFDKKLKKAKSKQGDALNHQTFIVAKPNFSFAVA